jgi:hypothetical protein
MPKRRSEKSLRVIQTARTEEAINEAARAGYFPLVKKVSPSPQIRSKFAVYQDLESGEISVVGDYRAGGGGQEVIGFTFYYPHNFPSPFAAYLIPPDLQVGEVVILEDLIEDLVGMRWNQGDVYRLQSCEAEWNGKDFILHYEESRFVEKIG